jgi:hypothetical protein
MTVTRPAHVVLLNVTHDEARFEAQTDRAIKLRVALPLRDWEALGRPDRLNVTMQTTDRCTCPSGDGSLRWPCPEHPPRSEVCTACNGAGGDAWDGPCTDCLSEGEIPAAGCLCRFTAEGWVNAMCPRHRGDDER